MTDLVNQDQSANQSVMTMMTSSVQVVPIMGSIFRPSPTHYPLSEDQKTKHGARSKNTQSKSSKRTSQSTLAVATAGQQQVREQHKRPHVPTNRFGQFELDPDQPVTHTIATNNRDLMDDLTVPDPPSKKSRRNKEPTLGASSTNQPLLFPPGLLFNMQAVTQPAAQQVSQSSVRDSNFLIDDNFSDTNAEVDDITVPPLAETASADHPATIVPNGSIDVPVDTHPTADSCIPANNASSTILPSNAAAAGAGGDGGDDDSIPPSDDADADDDDNESQQSHHANASGNDEADGRRKILSYWRWKPFRLV